MRRTQTAELDSKSVPEGNKGDRTRKKAWVQRSKVGPDSRVVRVASSNRAGKAGSVRMGQRPFLGPR